MNNNNFNNGLSSREDNTSNGNIADNNQLNNQNKDNSIVFDKNMNSNLMSVDSQLNQRDNQALNNNNLNNTYSQQQSNYNIYSQFVGDNNSNMDSQSTNIKSKKSKILIIGIIAALIIILGVIIVINIFHNTKESNKLTNNNTTSQSTKSENYSTCAKEGNKCSQKDIIDGQLVNVSVNNKTNYDFYVVDDDGENLTLLKRKSLGDIVAWCSRDDKYDVFLAEENADDNIYGPYTALKYLNELTNDWTNIDFINNYNFENPNTWGNKAYLGLNIQEGVITLISNSSTTKIVPGQARARLLTESEFKYITGTQDDNYNGDNNHWLDKIIKEEYDSIHSDDEYDREKIGHAYIWLLNADYSGQAASTIMKYQNTDMQVANINVWNKLMLYPVITIKKNQIN